MGENILKGLLVVFILFEIMVCNSLVRKHNIILVNESMNDNEYLLAIATPAEKTALSPNGDRTWPAGGSGTRRMCRLD